MSMVISPVFVAPIVALASMVRSGGAPNEANAKEALLAGIEAGDIALRSDGVLVACDQVQRAQVQVDIGLVILLPPDGATSAALVHGVQAVEWMRRLIVSGRRFQDNRGSRGKEALRFAAWESMFRLCLVDLSAGTQRGLQDALRDINVDDETLRRWVKKFQTQVLGK